MWALALPFLRRWWPELAIGLAFALLFAVAAGYRAQAHRYERQRDDARAALAYSEALGRQQAERAVAAEKRSQAALREAQDIRETAYADVDRWQRVAATRSVRVCVDPGPRTGAVSGAAGAGSGNDAAGAVADIPREVGPDLVALAADADRVAARLEQCQAYVRDLPRP